MCVGVCRLHFVSLVNFIEILTYLFVSCGWVFAHSDRPFASSIIKRQAEKEKLCLKRHTARAGGKKSRTFFVFPVSEIKMCARPAHRRKRPSERAREKRPNPLIFFHHLVIIRTEPYTVILVVLCANRCPSTRVCITCNCVLR